jgi:hypothetical protein
MRLPPPPDSEAHGPSPAPPNSEPPVAEPSIPGPPNPPAEDPYAPMDPAHPTDGVTARAGGKTAVIIVVALFVVLAVLVVAIVRIGGGVLSKIELPDGSTGDGAFAGNPEPSMGDDGAASDPGVDDDYDSPLQDDYLVGQDLEEGTYRLAEPFVGEERWDACSWAIYSNGAIEDENFLSSEVISGGRGAMTLTDGQLLTTYNCGDWVAVDTAQLYQDPDAAAESFGVGAWLVGEDVRPGTYEMVSEFQPADENDYCYFSASARWSGDEDDFGEGEFTSEPAQYTVVLETGDLMNSDNCGEWERVDE